MRSAAAILLLLAGCGAGSGPVPIQYGEDACDQCRMLISEAPFAAEARFGPDLVEKYDDIGCLARRLLKSPPPSDVWVADHASGRLLPVKSTVLVHASSLKTPMASGVAAFADRADAQKMVALHQGRVVTLDEVKAMRAPPGERK